MAIDNTKKRGKVGIAPVQYVRQEVVDLQSRWDLVRDCIAGQEQIKKRRETYLPRPNANRDDKANKRYDNYLNRAIFYNVTGRTLLGLRGLVFSKAPVIELPPSMELMLEDADGAGVSIEQQSQKALSLVLAHGRAGLLADYPKKIEATTRKELMEGEIKPTITIYDPWDIINWRVSMVGGKLRLTLVVLDEQNVVDDDGFEQETEEQIREIRLTPEGVVVNLWRRDEKNDFVVAEVLMPTDSKGQRLKEIPFFFIGADNNDATPDLPPLYDLAVLNIGHYHNSADYEESSFMVGQPTPVFAGLTEDWVKKVMGGKIQLGSDGSVCLPKDASATLLQAEPNIMPKEAMELKEAQMVALGARLVQDASVQRTATEAGADKKAENSVLANCANNVSKAYTKALGVCALFVGADPEKASLDLHVEFDVVAMGAPEIAAYIAAWQANAIAKSEMRDKFRATGVAFLDDEEFQEEIDSEGPELGAPVQAQKIAETQAALDAKSKATKETPFKKKAK